MTEKINCEHLIKHTEYDAPSPGLHVFQIMFGRDSSFTVPPSPGSIDTFCADCGEKLKTVVVEFKST